MHTYGDMVWIGDELRLSRRIVAAIEPDPDGPDCGAPGSART
jgi:hypothetical protein